MMEKSVNLYLSPVVPVVCVLVLVSLQIKTTLPIKAEPVRKDFSIDLSLLPPPVNEASSDSSGPFAFIEKLVL